MISILRCIFLVVVILSAIGSCKRITRSTNEHALKEVAPETLESVAEINAKTRHQFEDEERHDSLELLRTLRYAQEFSRQKIESGVGPFTTELKLPERGSRLQTKVLLTYGQLFAKGARHLMVKIMGSSGIYVYVFAFRKTDFVSLLSHSESSMTYMNDTTQDVNGDGVKDLIVQWYPSAGCCLRNICDVYLYQPDRDSFKSQYSFINPTFSASEGVVRGVGYGQPGDVELYKYKWNGLQLDTIEFIYHNNEDTLNHSFCRTNKRMHEANVVKQKLKAVPAEYRSITDFDWFGE